MRALRGPIAQLGERRVRNAEVVSSILIRSTTILYKTACCASSVTGCFALCPPLGTSDLSMIKLLAAADSRPVEPMTAARPELPLVLDAQTGGKPPVTCPSGMCG